MTLSTIEQAAQVAALINSRNELTTYYTPERVFEKKENYIIIMEGDKVVACGETKKVQWYQWEIRHVSVMEGHEGKHHGTTVVKSLENIIRTAGGLIAQCTIRRRNVESDRLFIHCDFVRTIEFRNSATGNMVDVYQKNLTDPLQYELRQF